MDIEAVYREMEPIFRDVFDDDALALSPAMKAADVDGWDSLAHIRLVVAVEGYFGVKFTSFEINAWPDVGAFAQSVQKHLAANGK